MYFSLYTAPNVLLDMTECFAWHCLPFRPALQCTVSPSRLRCLLKPSKFHWIFHFNLFSVCYLLCFKEPDTSNWPVTLLTLPPLKEKFVQCLFKVFFFIIDELISKNFHCCIRSIWFWKGNCRFLIREIFVKFLIFPSKEKFLFTFFISQKVKGICFYWFGALSFFFCIHNIKGYEKKNLHLHVVDCVFCKNNN